MVMTPMRINGDLVSPVLGIDAESVPEATEDVVTVGSGAEDGAEETVGSAVAEGAAVSEVEGEVGFTGLAAGSFPMYSYKLV